MTDKKTAREAALELVKIYQGNDWEISEETPEYFKLRKNTASMTGHILILLFFGWWTLGLANLIYYLVSKKTKKIFI